VPRLDSIIHLGQGVTQCPQVADMSHGKYLLLVYNRKKEPVGRARGAARTHSKALINLWEPTAWL